MPYDEGGNWIPTRPKDRTETSAWGPYTFGRHLTEHMGRAGVGAKRLGRLLQGLNMPAQGPWGGGVGRGAVVGMNDIRNLLATIPLLPYQMQMLQALAPNFMPGMNPLMPPGRQAPVPETQPPPPPPPTQQPRTPTPRGGGGGGRRQDLAQGPGYMPTQAAQQPQQQQVQQPAPQPVPVPQPVVQPPVINPGAPGLNPAANAMIDRFQPNPAIQAYLANLQANPPIQLPPTPVVMPYGRFLP